MRGNMKEHAHYITEDSGEQIGFGEGMQNIYALPDASVLRMKGENVQLAVHEFGQGKAYVSADCLTTIHTNIRIRSFMTAMESKCL